MIENEDQKIDEKTVVEKRVVDHAIAATEAIVTGVIATVAMMEEVSQKRN